ncbi:MAG: hypothetical protein JOZ96_19110 [Acidobacteria bacterium]|nr:hypothetical protein [Acidobacteriota bacterium]
MNLKAARFLIFACGLLLLSSARAAACECVGHSSPAEAFESATAVFVGTVVSARTEVEGEYVHGEQTAVLRAEEVFKGLEVGHEIKLLQPGGDCSPKYKAGQRRLFYANYDSVTKTWEVYGCGRGGGLEYAADDLLYLHALPRSAQRNRVSGALARYEEGFKLVGPLAGVKVRIKGEKKTYEATTDANGVYELYDLPAGTYIIEPELPPGLKVHFPMAFGPKSHEVWQKDGHATTSQVGLTEKTCAGSDFVVVSDNKGND